MAETDGLKERIQEFLDDLGIDATTLAREIGIEPSTISRWKDRIILNPRAASLKKVADYLGTTVTYLKYGERSAVEEKRGQAFALNLRGLLAEKKITGKALAEKIGVNENTISRWLNQHHAPPDRQIERVADFFGVPPRRLLAVQAALPAPAAAPDQAAAPAPRAALNFALLIKCYRKAVDICQREKVSLPEEQILWLAGSLYNLLIGNSADDGEAEIELKKMIEFARIGLEGKKED